MKQTDDSSKRSQVKTQTGQSSRTAEELLSDGVVRAMRVAEDVRESAGNQICLIRGVGIGSGVGSGCFIRTDWTCQVIPGIGDVVKESGDFCFLEEVSRRTLSCNWAVLDLASRNTCAIGFDAILEALNRLADDGWYPIWFDRQACETLGIEFYRLDECEPAISSGPFSYFIINGLESEMSMQPATKTRDAAGANPPFRKTAK